MRLIIFGKVVEQQKLKLRNKVYSFKDKINFGKHQGQTVQHIFKSAPSYLLWASNNLEFFILEEGIITEAQRNILIEAEEFKQFKLNSKITFGKYKNRLVSYVFKKDPEYLIWAINNIDFFIPHLSLSTKLSELKRSTDAQEN